MSEAILIPQFDPDLSGYSLVGHTHSQYLTEHQSLSNYATKTYVQNQIAAIDFPDAGVTTFNGRAGAVVPKDGDYTADMVGAAAKTHEHSQYLTEHQDLSSYATKNFVTETVKNPPIGPGPSICGTWTDQVIGGPTTAHFSNPLSVQIDLMGIIVEGNMDGSLYTGRKRLLRRGESVSFGGISCVSNNKSANIGFNVSFSESGILRTTAFYTDDGTTGCSDFLQRRAALTYWG